MDQPCDKEVAKMNGKDFANRAVARRVEAQEPRETQRHQRSPRRPQGIADGDTTQTKSDIGVHFEIARRGANHALEGYIRFRR
jgi:hypothetical protein